ncbi:magnesium/cobalt transporter CorA [Patescibacteria group bacterium]|nr:magnesium/cobalt transporter CorA [Patescibacteria group bacterium]
MSRLIKKRSQKKGLSPGSLVFVGTKKTPRVQISVISYNQEKVEEKNLKDITEAFPFKKSPEITWLNVEGLHETEIINKIGEYCKIHPLILEDALNTDQRPKIEIFDDYIFIVLKMLNFEENKSKIISNQVSLILGKDFVISLDEGPSNVFDPLIERIKKRVGRIRDRGPDYLTYAIMDIITDYYFMILEEIGEKIEIFEKSLLFEQKSNILNEIYGLKREVLFLRKAIWPFRDSINKLKKSESSLIKKKTLPYLEDLYDHTIQIIDIVETARDLLSGMLDLYLSNTSNRMNEVMKVLTIIATIFIPLTFIAGIYGMNFSFMPELSWSFGYFAVLGLMFLVAGAMIVYFKKKRWL